MVFTDLRKHLTSMYYSMYLLVERTNQPAHEILVLTTLVSSQDSDKSVLQRSTVKALVLTLSHTHSRDLTNFSSLTFFFLLSPDFFQKFFQ